MNNYLLTLIFPLMMLSTTSLLAEDTRHIHINNEHLTSQGILDIDTLTGGVVPNGFYWLNLKTGQWGYEGSNDVKGIIASIANYNNVAQNNNENTSQANNNTKDKYNAWEGVSSTGTVTSGKLNGQNCTFVSAGGMTMKSCD